MKQFYVLYVFRNAFIEMIKLNVLRSASAPAQHLLSSLSYYYIFSTLINNILILWMDELYTFGFGETSLLLFESYLRMYYYEDNYRSIKFWFLNDAKMIFSSKNILRSCFFLRTKQSTPKKIFISWICFGFQIPNEFVVL